MPNWFRRVFEEWRLYNLMNESEGLVGFRLGTIDVSIYALDLKNVVLTVEHKDRDRTPYEFHGIRSYRRVNGEMKNKDKTPFTLDTYVIERSTIYADA